MQDNPQQVKPAENDFFDRPAVIKWILRIFYAGCVLLVALDFVVHRHIYTDMEKIPTFYAIYGFIACVVLVLIATQMRKILMRDEDYYEKHSDMPNDVSKADLNSPLNVQHTSHQQTKTTEGEH